jgi:predicted DNA-binding protein with PD1-like motif
MNMLPIRLVPGQDLRRALEAAIREQGWDAAFVVSGIGSLGPASLRLAGQDRGTEVLGPSEIISLAGSISRNGAHLHAALADASGRVIGGHVNEGCTVRTTAEILVVGLPQWEFTRATDPATGDAELMVRHRETGAGS